MEQKDLELESLLWALGGVIKPEELKTQLDKIKADPTQLKIWEGLSNDKKVELLKYAISKKTANLYEPPESATEDEPAELPKVKGKLLFKQNNLTQTALVAGVVAIGVFLVMVMMGGMGLVTKTDFSTNLNNMNVSLAKAVADVNSVKDSLSTQYQSLSVSIPSQVNNAVSSQLGGVRQDLSAQISELTAKLTNTNTAISSLAQSLTQAQQSLEATTANLTAANTMLASYEARLKALETPVVPVSKKLDITTTYQNQRLLVSDNKTLMGSFRLNLVNNTGKDLNDVVVFVMVSYQVPSTSTATLSGGNILWQRGVINTFGVEFMSSSFGISVKAGETKSYVLTFQLVGNSSANYLPEQIYTFEAAGSTLN